MVTLKIGKVTYADDRKHSYDIWKGEGGVIGCTCPHYMHRLMGTDEQCKHIKRWLPQAESVGFKMTGRSVLEVIMPVERYSMVTPPPKKRRPR